MMSTNKRYKATTEHLSCDLNGEAVILNIKNGKYYGVNPVGATIWEVIQSPASFDEMKSAILLEYDVDEETCEREIKTFLDQMKEEDLVEIINEKAV